MIPCELLHRIFSHLHGLDVARARAVSRYWLQAVDELEADKKCQLRKEWRELEQLACVKAAMKRGLDYVRKDASACLTVECRLSDFRSYVIQREIQQGILYKIATAFPRLLRLIVPTFSGEDRQLKMHQMSVHGPMTCLEVALVLASRIQHIFISKQGNKVSLYQDCGVGYIGRLESESES